ncbi:MAG TPA: outer membrane protein assembly factor BamD [Steroidobacteraceae bacterium]|nr:outer membrane protein assembly factor BamD [Steroidobacteraceae bacterium]
MLPDRPLHRSARLLMVVLLSSLVLLGGCSTYKHRKDLKQARLTPEQIYSKGHKNLERGNYSGAIKDYESLEARYPFSEQAKQGHLDLLFAYYKNHALESAIDQADEFIRENPANPRVDYAWYIKGLVYYESGANALERAVHADVSKRPPGEIKKSLQSFQTLLQQYPKSPYASDARQRLVFLRNRLADYEVAVARYYMKRGAYIGAASRARGVIEQYDGAPAVDAALKIMAAAYRKLGINDLAGTVDQVLAANPPPPPGWKPKEGVLATLSGGEQPQGPVGVAVPATVAAASSPGGLNVPFTANAMERAGRWEAIAGVNIASGTTVNFQGGTTADIYRGEDLLLGTAYHFNDYVAVGGELGIARRYYSANVVGETNGATYAIDGRLSATSLMLTSTYDILARPLTPFISGGVGWGMINTNIATSAPVYGCWWYPWLGYVCQGFQDTKTLSGFAYEFGGGLRWDFSSNFDARASYNMKWMDMGNTKSRPSFDGFELMIGWKF